MMIKNYDSFSKDDLIKELVKLKKRKKFGLVWEEKRENVVEYSKSKFPVLEEKIEKKLKIINPLSQTF